MTDDEVRKELYIRRRVDDLVEMSGVSRLVARLCLEKTSKIMTDLGFNYITTGGPCTAWSYDLPDGSFLLVTDDGGENEAIFMDLCCMVGRYFENGDYRNVERFYLRDFIAGWKA